MPSNQEKQTKTPQSPATTGQGNQLALVKKNVVDVVANKIRQFQEDGEIHFPAGYSPENAMKSAWLVLQEQVVKKKENGQWKEYPVLTFCTHNSICNSLLSMIVQGLNVGKNQGYFVPYGKKLSFQRSYMGSIAIAKTLAGAEDVDAQVVYKGEDVTFKLESGRIADVQHTQHGFPDVSFDNIVGAYATIFFPNGKKYIEKMSKDQIVTAWKQSRQKPFDDGGNLKPDTVHAKFPDEMCKRSVINRTCKRYINTSSDSALLKDVIRKADEEVDEAAFEEEVEENANLNVIDIDYDETVDTETVETKKDGKDKGYPHMDGQEEVVDAPEEVRHEYVDCPKSEEGDRRYRSACDGCREKDKGCPEWPQPQKKEDTPEIKF